MVDRAFVVVVEIDMEVDEVQLAGRAGKQPVLDTEHRSCACGIA